MSAAKKAVSDEPAVEETTPGDDLWSRLEEKILAAGEEIARLRRENKALSHRVGHLEEQADVTPPEWKRERTEVKKRIEGLVSRLEELLEDEA